MTNPPPSDLLEMQPYWWSRTIRSDFDQLPPPRWLTIDVATGWGYEKNKEDFGQTLGVWGLGPGPYFVLPLFVTYAVFHGV